jgi:septal ring factor EnvC (AmiA/AmiB activator)
VSDPSLDLDTIIVASAAVLFSAGAWISSNRARREQTRLNREKAESEAFIRIETMYTTALATLESQLKVANSRISEQNRKIHDLETSLSSAESKIDVLEKNVGPP